MLTRSVVVPVSCLTEHIQGGTDYLYAILDACNEARVPPKIVELGERAVSLYRGRAERDYSEFAPYLVRVDESLLDWIIKTLSAEPWGLFAVADVELAIVRNHFRRFLTVEGPHGKRMLFRFYDPRVLPTFLQSCTDEEARSFFGVIKAFYYLAGKQELTRIDRDR